MLSTRMLARLLMLAVGASTSQLLVAAEPDATKPPAQSIREWMNPNPTPTPTPAPASSNAPAPTGKTLAGTSLMSPAAAPAATTSQAPARSIHEWMTTPNPTAGPCPTVNAGLPATPVPNSPAKPLAGAGGATSPITISIKSTMRQGNLVVMLDGAPIFNESFQKPLLFISQTTKWDPIQVTPGTHRLTAKVYGAKKTYVSKTYDLQLSRTKGAALHFVMQGETLTVALAS